MKQDSAAWKFRTQNLVATCTLNLRTNFEYFPKSILGILYVVLKLGKLGVQLFKQCTNGAKMKKLWLFKDNYAKLKSVSHVR